MEKEDGFQAQDSNDNITLPPSLCRVTTHYSKRQRQVSRLCDMWIPFFPISPNHFIINFIPGVEDLFLFGDWILRVENSGLRSWLVSWRPINDEHFGIWWQMDSADEYIFIFLPFEVVILDSVVEGRQTNFNYWWKCNLNEPCQFNEWWHIALI